MQEFFFESKKSDNIVKLLKDENNIVWLVRYHIDNSEYDFILEFCKMIKFAFDSAKEKGGEVHAQYISKDDWNNFIKNDDRWELIEELDEETIHIACDIDDASSCIIDGFMNENKVKTL